MSVQGSGGFEGADLDGDEEADLDGDDEFDDDFDDEEDEDEDDEDDDDFDDEDFDEDDEDFDEDEDEDDDDDLAEDEDDDDEVEDLEDLEDDYEPGDVNALDVPYEAGDVNTLSASAGRTRGMATASRGEMPLAVLEYLARAMADEPDAVAIRPEERRGSTILRLHVAQRDMGRVIGRRGRTAQAIRTLVGVAAARDGVQTVVDIADD